MDDNDHLAVTRLEDGVFDVVVQNVHFVPAHRRETETCAGSMGSDKGQATVDLELNVCALCSPLVCASREPCILF